MNGFPEFGSKRFPCKSYLLFSSTVRLQLDAEISVAFSSSGGAPSTDSELTQLIAFAGCSDDSEAAQTFVQSIADSKRVSLAPEGACVLVGLVGGAYQLIVSVVCVEISSAFSTVHVSAPLACVTICVCGWLV